MNGKKSVILTVVAVATLIALVVGATFAYFQASVGSTTSAEVKVTTYTSDLLTFTTGEEIAITADQSNFANGLDNRTGESFARAHLLANNKTNTATANYYVYLNITNNTFEYTQEDETAELVLQVTDPTGVEVTTISGLEYVTVTDGKGNTVKGFDITTVEDLITIANNHTITANNETTQTWNIKVVFVNLDADQNANTGKALTASLKVQKEKEVQTMAMVCNSGQTLASCVQAMYGKDDTLYHHTSSLANGAGDNSYRYAGANPNNYVCFGSNAETCPDDNLYRIIGVFGNQVKLIKWDYATTALLGTDGDYSNTYQSVSNGNLGTNKGTNAQTAIGAYYWNYANSSAAYNATNYYNVWSYSKLNTVNLNTNFLNNIGSTWASKIATTTWKVGGNTYANIRDVKAATAYTNEYTSPAENTTYNAKIGLMYTSDYGFAAAPSAWTTNLSSYNNSSITAANWMYMGLYEWIVVRVSGDTSSAFYVNFGGYVHYSNVYNLAFAVRPVFHLESSVNYGSGLGSKANPVRLS